MNGWHDLSNSSTTILLPFKCRRLTSIASFNRYVASILKRDNCHLVFPTDERKYVENTRANAVLPGEKEAKEGTYNPSGASSPGHIVPAVSKGLKGHAVILLSQSSPLEVSRRYIDVRNSMDDDRPSLNGPPNVLSDWIHFDAFMDSDSPQMFVSTRPIVHVPPSFFS